MNDRIINEWYNLFIARHNTNDTTKYEYWKHVQQYGLSASKDEYWKHVSFHELFTHKFINLVPNKQIDISKINLLSLNLQAYQLIFINGLLVKKLSNQNIGPWTINILPQNNQTILPKPIKPEIFLYLTECLSYETTYIMLPKNTICKTPLYLLHINQGISNNKKELVTTHYRHHIQIEDNSYGEIIEHFTSLNKYAHFTGARTSIVAGKNTKIQHTKLICENETSFHIAHNDIHGHNNSIIQSNIFSCCNNHFNRHHTSALLNNQGANLTLNSLFMPFNKNISNISTYVEHNNIGYTSSKQLHKIIACNQGQGIFHGLIKVNKHTIKTDGQMTNKNLLLDQSAKIYTMPQLEIYADDVQCSHGATIGHINHEQIFYLCTRGISYKQAYQMIIYAFTYEITAIIHHNCLRDIIINHVTHMLIRNIKHNDIPNTKN